MRPGIPLTFALSDGSEIYPSPDMTHNPNVWEEWMPPSIPWR